MTTGHATKVAEATGPGKNATDGSATPLRRLHILVVDDNPVLRQVIRRTLMKYFSANVASVMEAKDGLSALDQLENGVVDLVVLDLQMPLMTGADVLETIRRSPRHAQLPIVVVTGSTEADLVSRLLRLGVAAYLVKPLSVSVLRERLSSVIADASRRPAPDDSAAGGPRRCLDLRPASQVLIVEQDPDLRRFWMEQLRTLCRVDEVATSTAAMRKHHAVSYDIVVVGHFAGLLVGQALADKLREMSPFKPVSVLALVPAEGAASAVQSGRYDGVLTKTTDVKQWLDALATCLTPPSIIRILLGPSSPYVAAMFTKAGELFQATLKADVEVLQALPVDTDSGGRSFVTRVPFHSGEISWHICLTGTYASGLAVATASQGIEADRLSETAVLGVMNTIAAGVAETLQQGFTEMALDCRRGAPVSEVRDTAPAAAVGSTRDTSRWLFTQKLDAGVHLRLVSETPA